MMFCSQSAGKKGEISNVPFPGYAGAPPVLNRSYTFTAEIEIPQGGAEGMLVTDGGRFGGYGCYLPKGRVKWRAKERSRRASPWDSLCARRRRLCRVAGISEQRQPVVDSRYPGKVTGIRYGQTSVRPERVSGVECGSKSSDQSTGRAVRCRVSGVRYGVLSDECQGGNRDEWRRSE
jgi:hypothetical protein